MARLVLVLACVCACSAGEGLPSTGTGGTSLATTDLPSTGATTAMTGSTGEATGTATTGATGEGTGTSDAPTSSTSGTGTSEGSTGTTCAPGAEGCACDAGACARGLECVDDLCVALVTCDDPAEPDDDEDSAQDLGEISDDDGDAVLRDGVLSGASDLDWFRYHGLDTFGYVVSPTVKLTASAGVRLCQFIECDAGGVAMTGVACPQGTVHALSGALRPGCCGSAVFTLEDIACEGTNDDATIYVRLDRADEHVCVEYSLTVNY